MMGVSKVATLWKYRVLENTRMPVPIASEAVVIVIAEPALYRE